MKNLLLEIINSTHKKQISARVKGNKELLEWVNKSTPDDCTSISERISFILNGDNRYCPIGNRKQFNRGKYLFCGHQSQCICANKSTAKKVANTKASFSKLENDFINEKRKATIQTKYGVPFISQSKEYKIAIKENNENKYGKWHTQTHIPDWALSILNDKEKLIDYLSTKSRKEILKEFNIYYGTFNNYCKKYDLYETSRSYFENDIKNFLELNNITFIQNSRSIIPPKELDFYLPDFNIAIECNGLYWHTEDKVDKNYHNMKYNLCKDIGIHLITIFEDEWLEKQDLVKNRLLNKLKLINDRFFARKCKLKTVMYNDVSLFLKQNHIQGACHSQVNLGLYDNDLLVSLMTFGKNRRFINSKNHEYELVRFCSSKNVIGAASKLFKHFVNSHNPKNIISYSSNNWNTGSLYPKLGFIYDSENIGYSYTDNIARYHRYNFAKYKLVKEGFDSNKTECEIMNDRGFKRIWDCGNKKWIWNK